MLALSQFLCKLDQDNCCFDTLHYGWMRWTKFLMHWTLETLQWTAFCIKALQGDVKLRCHARSTSTHYLAYIEKASFYESFLRNAWVSQRNRFFNKGRLFSFFSLSKRICRHKSHQRPFNLPHHSRDWSWRLKWRQRDTSDEWSSFSIGASEKVQTMKSPWKEVLMRKILSKVLKVPLNKKQPSKPKQPISTMAYFAQPLRLTILITPIAQNVLHFSRLDF